LDAEQAQPPSGRRAGMRALAAIAVSAAALTWAITSGIAQLARVNFEPLPPSVVTSSTAQIAKIKG
jgi:hypothetical protein